MNIETLYKKIYPDNSTKSFKYFIDHYEAHKELIETTDTSKSIRNYDAVMRITADYGISLTQNGNLKKSLPYLDKAIALFDQHSEIKESSLLTIPLYEALTWNRGIVLYEIGKFKQAAFDFQKLVKLDPENDRYNNWLIGCKISKIQFMESICWASIIPLYIITLFFEKQLGQYYFPVLAIAVLLFALALGLTGIKFLIRKKMIVQRS